MKVVEVPVSKRIWRKIYWACHHWWNDTSTPKKRRFARLVAEENRKAASCLSADSQQIESSVRSYATEICGPAWNYYSGSLIPASLTVYEAAITALQPKTERISYLEIGSANGISMALIGRLIKKRWSGNPRLVSIDPYFADGFVEGARGPVGREFRVSIDKAAKARARALYARCGVDVELIEQTSTQALTGLIAAGDRFDLIYIDGGHEGLQPMIDFGLCVPLLKANGIIMLDDHLEWPDVTPVKALCDLHAVKIAESLKVAAYAIERPVGANCEKRSTTHQVQTLPP
jgi:predicted O-methyltransferase YrrM